MKSCFKQQIACAVLIASAMLPAFAEEVKPQLPLSQPVRNVFALPSTLLQVYLPNSLYMDKPTPLTLRQKGLTAFTLSYHYENGYQEKSEPQQVRQACSAASGVERLMLPALPPVTTQGDAASPLAAWSLWVMDDLQGEVANPTATAVQVRYLGPDGLATQKRSLPLAKTSNSNGLGVMPTMPGVNAQAIRGVSQMADFAMDEDKRNRLMDDGTRNTQRQTDRNSFATQGANLTP